MLQLQQITGNTIRHSSPIEELKSHVQQLWQTRWQLQDQIAACQLPDAALVQREASVAAELIAADEVLTAFKLNKHA